MKSERYAKVLITGLIILLISSMTVSAQLSSLVIWENAAGGTLTTTWTEKSDANWAAGLVSGAGVYNCTTSGVNWTTPTGAIFGDQGHRWYATFEAKVDDSNLGIGLIYAYETATNWNGWLYILEDRWDD